MHLKFNYTINITYNYKHSAKKIDEFKNLDQYLLLLLILTLKNV